ncbi:MAG: SMC-Scp complex subunit ScpB [Bacteroidia bacterium]|nr:SMC-Scp complex subunit ScpB [Bacteroidia bacterium]
MQNNPTATPIEERDGDDMATDSETMNEQSGMRDDTASALDRPAESDERPEAGDGQAASAPGTEEGAPAASEAPDEDAAGEDEPVDPADDDELRGILEALIFASDEPLTFKQIKELLAPDQQDESDEEAGPGKRRRGIRLTITRVKRCIDTLNSEFEEAGRAFRIIEVSGGFAFQTTGEYGAWVGRLFAERSRRRLTQSALETLAIIAFKQPISKPAIEGIRGVNAEYVVKSLLERNLISIVGREDSPGRPLLYGTTKNFLKHFGLSSISDLPKPREIEDLLSAEDELAVNPIDEMDPGQAMNLTKMSSQDLERLFDTARLRSDTEEGGDADDTESSDNRENEASNLRVMLDVDSDDVLPTDTASSGPDDLPDDVREIEQDLPVWVEEEESIGQDFAATGPAAVGDESNDEENEDFDDEADAENHAPDNESDEEDEESDDEQDEEDDDSDDEQDDDEEFVDEQDEEDEDSDDEQDEEDDDSDDEPDDDEEFVDELDEEDEDSDDEQDEEDDDSDDEPDNDEEFVDELEEEDEHSDDEQDEEDDDSDDEEDVAFADEQEAEDEETDEDLTASDDESLDADPVGFASEDDFLREIESNLPEFDETGFDASDEIPEGESPADEDAFETFEDFPDDDTNERRDDTDDSDENPFDTDMPDDAGDEAPR